MKPSLFLISLFSISMFNSCVSTVSSEDIFSLLSSKGSYTGSIIYDEWLYYGSIDDVDLFKYTWNEVHNEIEKKM